MDCLICHVSILWLSLFHRFLHIYHAVHSYREPSCCHRLRIFKNGQRSGVDGRDFDEMGADVNDRVYIEAVADNLVVLRLFAAGLSSVTIV